MLLSVLIRYQPAHAWCLGINENVTKIHTSFTQKNVPAELGEQQKIETVAIMPRYQEEEQMFAKYI